MRRQAPGLGSLPMPSESSTFRSLASTLRHLPSLRAQLVTLTKDQRVLVQQVREVEDRLAEMTHRLQHAEDRANGVEEALARLHQTLVDADPQLAMEIVTAVRDDVRTLLVEVTEQANAASAALLSPQ